jgi:hypothetical protein
LAQQIAAAKTLPVEDLGGQIQATRRSQLLWAPNPDGKTYDMLQVYFPKYGGPNSMVVMDLGSGEVKNIEWPRALNLHLCPAVLAPNGKLYLSVLDLKQRQQICIYDPAKNELTPQALKMPDDLWGETHPLVLGNDGKLYAVGAHTSKAASAAQIDPETGKVTGYGAIGPSHAPSGCWAYSAGADDRYLYIASGKVPWYLVAYDKQTGKSEVLVTTEDVGGKVSISQGRFGCTASASKVVGTDGNRVDYWLYQGKAIPKKDRNERPPWPEPANPQPEMMLPPRPEVDDTLATPDIAGSAEIWCRTPEAKAAAALAPARIGDHLESHSKSAHRRPCNPVFPCLVLF